MIIHAYLGPTVARGRRFAPAGAVFFVVDGRCVEPSQVVRENPVEELKGSQLGARLLVGLSVKNVPTYSVKDVVKLVYDTRIEQGRTVNASIVAQKGIFSGSTGIIEEDSVQIIILDLDNLSREVFRADMFALAEKIARQMQQEIVILELQKKGIVIHTYGVTP